MLQIENLKLRVAGKDLLDKFSLNIKKGEKVAISGPSGCGKSTLLSCILGFIPPVKGQVFLDGTEVSTANLRHIRKQVAWVPQFQPAFTGTLREWLHIPLGYHANRHINTPKAFLDELLCEFLMDRELLDKPQDKLSGGEKQRAALIGAVLLQRPLIMLDEPTASLDENSREAVLNYFCNRSEATLLMVAHDEHALQAAGRIIRLKPGDNDKREKSNDN